MATDTTVRARIDERVKKEAATVLEAMGRQFPTPYA